jgi:putative flippase GtrA
MSNVPSSDVTDASLSKQNVSRQALYYFGFAVLMTILNILIQNFHKYWILPFIDDKLGRIGLIARFYLSTSPYDMPELIGSAIAVVITFIIKFILDKIIVFQKKDTNFQQTRKEFVIYFIFAILTTIINIGIQFILRLFTPESWITIRIIIALSIGYIVKFLLDRKYVFHAD